MGIAANPPPQSRLPEKLFNDDELRPYFTALQEDMYRIWLRSGGGTDKVDQIEGDLITINNRFNASTQARLTELEQRLGSGDPFTWDETGFSFDSTNITFDRTETG